MALETYFDFAENDYQFFSASYEHGLVANMMGAMAQGICEKYLKHLVDNYDQPYDQKTQDLHDGVMRTHNLLKLIKYLKNYVDITFSDETKNAMFAINGYYFSARYPGDESLELDKEDIDLSAKAIELCRNEIIQIIENRDHNFEQEDDLER